MCHARLHPSFAGTRGGWGARAPYLVDLTPPIRSENVGPELAPNHGTRRTKLFPRSSIPEAIQANNPKTLIEHACVYGTMQLGNGGTT